MAAPLIYAGLAAAATAAYNAMKNSSSKNSVSSTGLAAKAANAVANKTASIVAANSLGSSGSSGGSSGSYGYGGGSYYYSGPSSAERRAAANAKKIAKSNANSLISQYNSQMKNYDIADEQNRALADVELDQNSRKAANDRFAQNKKLQTSTQGLVGAAGNAMNGSGTENLLRMLNTRTDLDNNEVWDTLRQNQNTVENAYTESVNSNILARNDLTTNLAYALKQLEANLSADLNNIHSDLYAAPGSGDADLGSSEYANKELTPANKAQLSGYLMPDNALSGARSTQAANNINNDSYYGRLLNQYNRR